MKKTLWILAFLVVLVSSCTMRENEVLEEYNGTVATETDFDEGKLFKLLIPDLGYGKCVVMMLSSGECILVDCGSSDDFPKLYETLKKFDVNVIDCIILTSQSDAALGGLQKMLENFDVCQIYVSEHMKDTDTHRRIQSAGKMNNVLLNYACDGTRIYDFENICIDVVSSEKYAYGEETDAMCLYVICGNRSIFVEGECDIGAEAKMATELRGAIKSDVIIIPYSGTMEYQSQYFLEEADPHYAVIPVYNNNYPSADVLNNLTETEVLRTDLNGDIMFITDGNKLKVKIDK